MLTKGRSYCGRCHYTEFEGKKDVLGIGIGLPGLIDVGKGVVRVLPNIPGWENVPLKRLLEKKTGLRVQLENDVNMITLGEWVYGAGRGKKDLLCITLGTGVGAGLILNNNIYRGPGFAAGEIGHAPINQVKQYLQDRAANPV